jgi:hypothetical protein
MDSGQGSEKDFLLLLFFEETAFSSPKKWREGIGFSVNPEFRIRIWIRDPVPFLPWIRDPGWVKSQDPDPE